MKLELKLKIVKNPRKNDTFFDINATCSKCGKLSSYYAELTNSETSNRLMICKTCLGNMIEEIDKTMRDDMAKPVEVCRAEANQL